MSKISTEEQDGWAYVATGQEEYGPWVRYRARMRGLSSDSRRESVQRTAQWPSRSGRKKIVGNRGEIYVHEGDAPGVYLYTHWDATALPHVVQRSLISREGRNRWTDAPYLTRIIFEQLIRGYERQETGFGISAQRSEGPVVDVDVAAQTVSLGDGDSRSFTEFSGWIDAHW